MKSSNSGDNQFSRSSRLEAMQEMASAISFDLTDMVTVINHKFSTLKKKLEQDPTCTEDLKKIAATLEEMKRLAKGMRNLGLLGENQAQELLPLSQVMEGVLSLSRPWFETQKVTLETGKVPDVSIRCRPKQIAQAVINLLNNALDAAEAAPQKKVTLSYHVVGQSPRRLQISIEDSGKISPEVIAHMLEPFFSTKPQGKGLGLGLNVVKSIAEAHAGKLFFASGTPNTRFVFEIPITD